ncbi:hypothetical protein QJQ45_017847 [Haematococcus lacustris]|nr:hypothetical protein QJQ45_017847 [Haematococcus lacustris]
MADSLAPSSRHQYVHQGRVVYEWDQAFSEVNIYVQVPPGVRAKQLYCDIGLNSLKFGVSPNPPYLAGELSGSVKVSESFWTLGESGTAAQSLDRQPGPTRQSVGSSGAAAVAAADDDEVDQRCLCAACLDAEDGSLHITLQKLQQGEPWPSALRGHEADPLTQQRDTERLMLERFQQEHPGFDFSGASFNGSVPNPRTFMGGASIA